MDRGGVCLFVGGFGGDRQIVIHILEIMDRASICVIVEQINDEAERQGITWFEIIVEYVSTVLCAIVNVDIVRAHRIAEHTADIVPSFGYNLHRNRPEVLGPLIRQVDEFVEGSNGSLVETAIIIIGLITGFAGDVDLDKVIFDGDESIIIIFIRGLKREERIGVTSRLDGDGPLSFHGIERARTDERAAARYYAAQSDQHIASVHIYHIHPYPLCNASLESPPRIV